MDKKNTFLGTLLFIAAFAVLMYSQRFAPQRPAPAEIQHEVTKQMAKEGVVPVVSDVAAFTTVQAEKSEASVVRLSNGFVEVAFFTDSGGAIPATSRSEENSRGSRPARSLHLQPAPCESAMLAFMGLPGLDHDTRYQLVSHTASEVVYRAVQGGTLEVTRRYAISPDSGAGTDPYVIRSETTLRNLSDKATAPMRVAFSLGTAQAPNNALDNGLQLSTEFLERQGPRHSVQRSRAGGERRDPWLQGPLTPCRLSWAPAPVEWATVKNQFFAAILTPDQPASGLETRRVKLLQELPDTDVRAYGITGTMDFDLEAVPAHGQTTVAGNFYVGPKEYPRLSNIDVFKKNEDRMMDFGNAVFRFCAAILITIMTWIHSWAPNWGIAIILTTLTLKIAFTPITLAQSRSSRRMQKLMPEMKVIKEKYKDNPQKQQVATMELYKKHKVNPLSGCLPMLLTIPFFFAFFRMLQSASELRFASFLWAHDLSAPDTVAVLMLPFIGTFKLNILPLLLGAVNFFQMRVTPQPAVDNAQMKVMKFMPVMFVLFYYNWSCALSLYSCVNGLYTIGQQLIVNRFRDDDPVPVKSGKPTKNVTPRKG